MSAPPMTSSTPSDCRESGVCQRLDERPSSWPDSAPQSTPWTRTTGTIFGFWGSSVAVIDEPSGPSYGLGHADHELERLKLQAGLIEPITRRWLLEAGIKTGMRVLDVGSGVGDVALMAAELVGATGEVVGTDRATVALAIAAQRAKARSFRNVRFLKCDPSETAFDEPFDAIVGRYVLMYQADPVEMVRKLVTHLGPGGLVLFHEPYRDGIRSYPTVPSYDRARQLVDETLRGTGADPIM